MANESVKKFEKVCETIEFYGNDPAKLIPILQAVQDEYKYLPEAIMTLIATSLGITPARVYGVASFYSHFTLKPKGKYVIKVCDGTACHVKKSSEILEAVAKRLNLKENENTTPDMLFTLETVSCLGACGLAPAVVINEQVHGQMNPEKVMALIDEISQKEEKTDETAG